MDDRRDVAFKWLRDGMDALGRGDRRLAVDFLSKARSFDPSLPLDDLFSAACSGESSSSPSSDLDSDSENEFASSTSGDRSKTCPSKGSSNSNTEEQESIVRQIREQKDYYEILGLESSCTAEDIRRAYLKLSLKVHPDKNYSPGAEEAFKKVSCAFECLRDEENRERYDLCGSDSASPDSASAEQDDGHRHCPGGFDNDDSDTDETFRNFSGGKPQSSRMRRDVRFNMLTLIHISPVIILLLISFRPSQSPSPVYMMSPSHPYDLKVMTPRGVPYFVKPEKFEEEYPSTSSQRVTLEQKVEKNYFDTLARSCQLEMERGVSRQASQCAMLQDSETVI